MKIKVNKEACIGCGACANIAEGIFEINGEGVSEVIVDTIPEDKKDLAIEAMNNCPTCAIEEDKEEK